MARTKSWNCVQKSYQMPFLKTNPLFYCKACLPSHISFLCYSINCRNGSLSRLCNALPQGSHNETLTLRYSLPRTESFTCPDYETRLTEKHCTSIWHLDRRKHRALGPSYMNHGQFTEDQIQNTAFCSISTVTLKIVMYALCNMEYVS